MWRSLCSLVSKMELKYCIMKFFIICIIEMKQKNQILTDGSYENLDNSNLIKIWKNHKLLRKYHRKIQITEPVDCSWRCNIDQE